MIMTELTHGDIICPFCGTELYPDYETCPGCGAAVVIIRREKETAT